MNSQSETVHIQPDAAASIINGVAGWAVVALFILLAFYAFKMWMARQKKETKQQDPPPVFRDFNRANAHLSKMLDDVEADSAQAARIMDDIREKTRTLANLAIGLYREAERLSEEVTLIDAALAAVASRDIGTMRRTGAELDDADLQTLLLAEVRGSDYWDKVGETLDAQAGLISKQSRTFRRLATGLIADVRSNKARLMALQQQRKFADYARPLLQSSFDIGRAEHLLTLPARSEIRRYTLDAPTSYAELTGGEV